MPVIQPTQQCRTQRPTIVAGPLVDHQPASRIELLLALFQKAPGQMAYARAMIGIEIDEDQVGLLSRGQQLQGIANAHVQARIIIEPHVFHGQARHVRAQLDGLDILQRQELQAGLGQGTGPQPQEQRALRLRMAECTDQHRTRVVVLQPTGVGGEGTALLDGVTEFEEAIILDLVHTDDPVGIFHPGQQPFFPLRRHRLPPAHTKTGIVRQCLRCNKRAANCYHGSYA